MNYLRPVHSYRITYAETTLPDRYFAKAILCPQLAHCTESHFHFPVPVCIEQFTLEIVPEKLKFSYKQEANSVIPTIVHGPTPTAIFVL